MFLNHLTAINNSYHLVFWGGMMQENTRVKLQSVLRDLCGEDCRLEVFQEDRSDESIVSGNYVEGEQRI